jgi:chromosome segregation ATPase
MASKNEAQVLVAELDTLRNRLTNAVQSASRTRDAYENECRRLVRGDNAKALAAKQQLELATSCIEGIEAEIAEKARHLDEIQGREADETRRRKAQQTIERAREELSLSQAELERLRAEHLALIDKIRVADWRFQQALAGLHDLRCKDGQNPD